MIGAMARPAPPGRVGEPRFSAVLTPNRSLGRLGFFLVMALVCAVSFGAGVAFLLKGAWPILGFFGLNVLLVYIAFRMSYRSGKLSETVELTASSLTVRRRMPGGRLEAWEFQPYWLQVQIDDPPRSDSPLTLSSHGKRLAIGQFLSPLERFEFATVLRRELAGLRVAPDAEVQGHQTPLSP